MQNQINLDAVQANFDKVKQTLPVILANTAQNFFTHTFTEQGFDGKRWEEVQRRKPGTNAYKYPMHKGLTRRTKPILIGTGTLRRAVSNSIRSATWQSIRLVVDLPYAENQNEGITVPQRRFMGESVMLSRLLHEKIISNTNKIWQP